MEINTHDLNYDNLRDIIENVSIDGLISMYLTGSIVYRNFLNYSETILFLMNKLKLPTDFYIPIDFEEFIKIYDNYYASIRCENKYDIEKCIQTATESGQLYWALYYLNESSYDEDLMEEYATHAYLSAAKSNQVEIGKILLNNYDVISFSNIVQGLNIAIKNVDIPFIAMLINYFNEIRMLLYILYSKDISDKVANFAIESLDEKYAGWDLQDNSLYIIKRMITNLIKNSNSNIDNWSQSVSKYITRWPDAISGKYTGLAYILELDDFINEIKILDNNPKKNNILEEILLLTLDY